MEVSIREASVRDLERILSLYHEVCRIDTVEGMSFEKATGIYTKMQTYPDYKVYVAETGGVVAGTFALLVTDNLAHEGTPSGIVEDVQSGLRFKDKELKTI